VILLSLALVVATATTLAWGVFASSDPLIWASLGAGLGAVALVAGSVVRHRRHLVPEAIPDAGQQAGSTAVGAASAGVHPAPSPTHSRPTAPPAPPTPPPEPPAAPAAGPVSPPGTWPSVPPDAPRTTPAPGAPQTGAGQGWARPAPAPPPPPADEAPAAGPEPQDDIEGEPSAERVDLRDALRVAQLDDEVLVVDGHPRYHLAGCPTLAGAGTVPLAVSAARRGGFTPCAVCAPDAGLLARSRERARQKAEDRAAGRPNDDGDHI
jgi:hypothetical protein